MSIIICFKLVIFKYLFFYPTVFVKFKRKLHLPDLTHLHFLEIVTELLHVIRNLEQRNNLVYLLLQIRLSYIGSQKLVIPVCSVP